jgi:hypothetical protein
VSHVVESTPASMDAKKAREFADQCAEVLKTATDPKIREMMHRQRAAWLRIADEIEAEIANRNDE